MPVEWSEASPSVMATAVEIIARYHPSLRQVNIVFMFRDKAGRSGGKLVYGHAAKVSAQMRPLLDDADFIIWVSQEDWEQKKSPWRAALIDHLLCHCVNDSGETSIRPHDTEEFIEVIERHGLWSPSLLRADRALMAASQQPLPGIEKTYRGKTYTVDPVKMQQAAAETGSHS